MREEQVRSWTRRFLLGALTLMLVLTFGCLGTFISHAESQGTIIAPKGAVIRKEPNTSSEKVGSVGKGKEVTVLEKVDGTNGTLPWYQIKADSMTGYVRSDLIEVKEEPAGNEEPPAVVTPMDPVNATVKGDGRVRANASVTSQIVAEVPAGLVLTVTGEAKDAEGASWYQVSYNTEDSQVTGFIRWDYVEMAPQETPPVQTEDPGTQEPAPQTGPYQLIFQDEDWCLYDMELEKGYKVKDLFGAAQNVTTYSEMYQNLEADAKNQKIIVIILVFLLVAAVAAIAFLVFKIRDMMDAAYFSEVENDTLRKKKASAGQGGGQKVMHTVGTSNPQPRNGGRPAGASQSPRPAGNSQGGRPAGASQGPRPVGTLQGGSPTGAPQGPRPAGAPQGGRPVGAPQGPRPAGASQGGRPAGAPQGSRPAGAPQGGRPTGAPQSPRPTGTPQGGRPTGASQGGRPTGTPQGRTPGMPQGAQPAGEPQEKRQSGAPQGARPVQDGGKKQPKNNQQAGGWQSKNFMAEDEDEFEFDFLNYESDDQQ